MQPAIGILSEKRQSISSGILKAIPEDFVVRELHTAEDTPATITGSYAWPNGEAPFYTAILVKKNTPYKEALHLVANALGIEPLSLRFHGIKDTLAITAQQVSFPRPSYFPVTWGESVQIHTITPAKKQLELGGHNGNHFTITIRDTTCSDEQITERVHEIVTDGFPMLFDEQRFGPRQNNHHIGKEILAGNYEAAVKILVAMPSEREPAEVQTARITARENWGNPLACIDALQPFSHALRSEIRFLTFLQEGKTAKEYWEQSIPQARFYVNAYGSYLWNLALTGTNPPETHFSTLATTPEILQEYKERTGIAVSLGEAIPRALLPKSHILETQIRPKNLSWKREGTAIVLTFSLPKSAYATQLIRQIFSV